MALPLDLLMLLPKPWQWSLHPAAWEKETDIQKRRGGQQEEEEKDGKARKARMKEPKLLGWLRLACELACCVPSLGLPYMGIGRWAEGQRGRWFLGSAEAQPIVHRPRAGCV